MIYDTGSDWLVAESSTCDTCGRTSLRFNPGASTNFKVVGLSQSERDYGSASLLGNEVTDNVCLTADICMPSFEWFLIEKQSGLPD